MEMKSMMFLLGTCCWRYSLLCRFTDGILDVVGDVDVDYVDYVVDDDDDDDEVLVGGLYLAFCWHAGNVLGLGEGKSQWQSKSRPVSDESLEDQVPQMIVNII